MKRLIAVAAFAMSAFAYSVSAIATPAAAATMTLVEGAACAHLASQINDLETRNTADYQALVENQEAIDRGSATARNDAALLAAYNAMVTYRGELIDDYNRRCNGRSMSASDLVKICRTDAGSFNFVQTPLCASLSSSGL